MKFSFHYFSVNTVYVTLTSYFVKTLKNKELLTTEYTHGAPGIISEEFVSMVLEMLDGLVHLSLDDVMIITYFLVT